MNILKQIAFARLMVRDEVDIFCAHRLRGYIKERATDVSRAQP